MKKYLFVFVVAISLIMASCGGSTGPTTKLKVTMTDFQFSPNQFSVPAGQEITLDSSNTGAVVHNFVIMKLGTTAGTEYTEQDAENVYWQVELAPGGSVSTTFVAPSEPGEYEVVCRTAGHLQAGMVAKMIVVADE